MMPVRKANIKKMEFKLEKDFDLWLDSIGMLKTIAYMVFCTEGIIYTILGPVNLVSGMALYYPQRCF